MLWLGLYLPHLPLEVFQRTLPDAPAGHLSGAPAFAICNRASVELVNASALAFGVHPGQKRATALALAPALIIRDRDPGREQQALQQLGSWALQYTPRLSLQVPDAMNAHAGLLLDIEASLRLFGGLEALLQRLRREMQVLGYQVLIGCAPTATAAWLFARWQDGIVARTDVQLSTRLARLPVALLASLAAQGESMEAIGVRIFRDLSQLPRSGLARRFGKDLLLEMDLALGRQPELRPWFEAPLHFSSTLELLADVEHAEALLFAARRQLCELTGWLAARHAAVSRFVLEACHDRTGGGVSPRPKVGSAQLGRMPGETRWPVTRIEARFASPARDVERMLAVLRERLAVTRLPGAVHTLHLRCEEIVPEQAGDLQLFPVAATTEEDLGRLVERLQARLGRDQVQRVLLAADHRPEAAYRIETVEDPARPAASSSSAATTSAARAIGGVSSAGFRAHAPWAGQTPRPLWLLHHPIALRERNQRPWWRGPLKLLSGPERIEGGWWDCHLVQRDYFIAEDDHAQWFWIYRTRGHNVCRTRGHNGAPAGRQEEGPLQDLDTSWYLQGIFG